MLTEPSHSDCYKQAHWGWYALTRSLATRCQTISLLWGASGTRNYGVMTTSAGATVHNIAHHRSQVLVRVHGHLHYMCMSFARWARRAAGYYDDHGWQISSLSNLALQNPRIAFQRFEMWAAMLHNYRCARQSWMAASIHGASQMY